ncbi:MAG TPA: DUF2268 domain-containing putative Zn-dependent protease [Aridibacter sp.]|nr:DUF2268 domain-containing putative Zn-dependent protease [Aridibacter sp.]
MRQKTILLILAVLIGAYSLPAQDTDEKEPNGDPEKAEIVTSDIDLFWKAFDRATPENDLIVYRDEYLRKGTVGLQEFTRIRIGNVCELVETIDAQPRYFEQLRAGSMKIASFEPKIRESFIRLKEIYPDAVFPSVYFLIGRMNSAGTLTDKGLLIGVDMFGKTESTPMDELGDWHKAVISSIERLPFIVAHELIHYQQARPNDRSLLAAAVREGSADFIGELISGGQINPHLQEYGNARERELWLEFDKEMSGNDRSNWLYQGEKAKDRPADLGYYIGYKIAESFYKNAADKKKAVRDILLVEDFPKFLEASKYAEKFRRIGG